MYGSMSQECSLVWFNGIVETLKSVAKKCHISTWATLRSLVRMGSAGKVHTDHTQGAFATIWSWTVPFCLWRSFWAFSPLLEMCVFAKLLLICKNLMQRIWSYSSSASSPNSSQIYPHLITSFQFCALYLFICNPLNPLCAAHASKGIGPPTGAWSACQRPFYPYAITLPQKPSLKCSF